MEAENKCIICCIFLCILSLIGCNNNSKPSDSMAFDNVKFINEFPKTFTLSKPEVLDLGVLGADGLSVQDSLLIVSHPGTEGFWSFFALPDYRPLGRYLKNGRASDELLSVPRVSQQSFLNIDGNLYAMIYDYDFGRMLRMDITKSLSEGVGRITEIGSGVEKYLSRVAFLDTNVFFCRQSNQVIMSQDRYLLVQSERVVTRGMEELNKARVERPIDTNLMNTSVAYSPAKRLISEASLFLNTVNVYSVDDKVAPITICYGRKMKHLSKMNVLLNPDRTFKHIAGYDNYFATLYTGYNFDRAIIKRMTMHPKIQFFGWDPCEPLAEIVLDRDATSFDIDFLSGKLYTVSYETEEICAYDIKDVLEYLPS